MAEDAPGASAEGPEGARALGGRGVRVLLGIAIAGAACIVNFVVRDGSVRDDTVSAITKYKRDVVTPYCLAFDKANQLLERVPERLRSGEIGESDLANSLRRDALPLYLSAQALVSDYRPENERLAETNKQIVVDTREFLAHVEGMIAGLERKDRALAVAEGRRLAALAPRIFNRLAAAIDGR